MMRHEKIITRACGTRIRLIVLGFPDFRKSTLDCDFFAGVRKVGEVEETYVHFEKRSKSLGGMSVAEYTESGRRGLLAVVSAGEILKARMEFDAIFLAPMGAN